MALDNKLTSSILDLSRNVDKLTAELKKNQSVKNQEIAQPDVSSAITEVAEAIKDSGLKDLPKKIDGITQGFEKIDFSNLTKQIAQLDLKGLAQDLKNFKPGELAQQGIQKFATQTFKDIKSNIIGGLEKGGTVSKSGNYIVGEKGPEIVKLKTADKVVPNSDMISQEVLQILSQSEKERNSTLRKRPTGEEIGRKRMQLLIENPEYVDDPEELEREIKDYIDRYGRETFTMEDVAKLGKPVKPSEVQPKIEAPDNQTIVSPPKTSTFLPISKKSLSGEKSPLATATTPAPLVTEPLRIKKLESEKNEASRAAEQIDILKKEGVQTREGGKESGLSKISSKLGKFLGSVLNPGGKRGDETMADKKSINLDNSLGPAMKKSTPSSVVDFIKPTIQKSIPKISSSPKISKELGGLTKPAEPLKQMDDSKAMFGGLLDRMEQVFINKSQQSKESDVVSSQSDSSTKQEAQSAETPSSQSKSAGLSTDDVNEMKSALLRIASLLEGPLSIAPLDYPFRPDSRRV